MGHQLGPVVHLQPSEGRKVVGDSRVSNSRVEHGIEITQCVYWIALNRIGGGLQK